MVLKVGKHRTNHKAAYRGFQAKQLELLFYSLQLTCSLRVLSNKNNAGSTSNESLRVDLCDKWKSTIKLPVK